MDAVEQVWQGVERTGEEAVELHQEFEVNIIALGRLAMAAPNVVTIEVDTCERELRLARSSCADCVLCLEFDRVDARAEIKQSILEGLTHDRGRSEMLVEVE